MSSRSDPDSYKGAFFGVASVLLGLLVAVLGFAALLMWIDARNARHDARQLGQVFGGGAGGPGRARRAPPPPTRMLLR